MPVQNHDLHGNAPDKCETAFLTVDVINDLDFPGANRLMRYVPAAMVKTEGERRDSARSLS